MEINIRQVNQFKEVKVKSDNIVIDLGLLSEDELKALALEFLEAATELLQK